MSNAFRLLADIGGTNARFAWQAGPGQPLQHVQVMQCHDHAGLAEAVECWLDAYQLPKPHQAGVAVACAVHSDQIQLTNNPWSFSIQALQTRLGLDRLEVVNDFTALALGLPFIPAQHLHRMGGDPAQRPFEWEAPVALLGAGTGLGVSGLLPDRRGGWMPISGEGGHISLSIHTEGQYQVLTALQTRYGHVSAERVLSGQGLVNIHDCLWRQRTGHWPPQSFTPAQITTLALEKRDPLAMEVIAYFCSWLGSVAGDLVLTLGARGGVFIGGGIVPRLVQVLANSALRTSFEHKGRFATYLHPVPIWVIDTPVSPALDGVAMLLD